MADYTVLPDPEDVEAEPVFSADGTLLIHVESAKDLPNRRKLDKQNPYVTLRMGTTAKKTPSIFRGGQRPTWDHDLKFEMSRERKPILIIDVLDETKNEPTPIGHVEIDCSTVLHPDNEVNGEYFLKGWYDMTLNERRAGQILLDFAFYPHAPLLPPKIPANQDYGMTQSYDHGDSHRSSNSFDSRGGYSRSASPQKELPPSPKMRAPSVADQIFVSEDNIKKQKKFSLSSSSIQGFSSHANREVFINGADSGKKSGRFFDKLNKIKSKFNVSRDDANTVWLTSDAQLTAESSPRRSASPISLFGSDDENHVDSLGTPVVPPHSVHSMDSNQLSTSARKEGHSRSPQRKPPTDLQDDFRSLNLKKSVSSIPFSADSIGDDYGHVPTKVYLCDEPVTPLDKNKNIDGDDIAIFPTPRDHFTKERRLKDGHGVKAEDFKVDFRTEKTGYLGDGRFSPSVFQRVDHFDYAEDLGPKPTVPPKIPKGFTAQEYYATDRESYLKDINGKRF
ncbi:conserved hypothetical protein [Scheffersomyces stipitis CBS 6054]|uniref:C2 domain-containing protein n=1 Tax=Scheffersomyces stipitis (strain ATCC 58785 / CBS 6054 / NBRC 10063 / NRRL Y-11545) TaxID=322104 RepID=A3LR05_PICST|nr:conserved hypothetical protein [Scheffersomyces stipitis CBS 6054]ABN65303.2 conserved hypothetical protein [Scheffersomyces stipitis CBS 6054]KAG2733994.1 hypothetical protein G9P44_003519 [Scheffersomyces stipitis]